MSFANDDPTVFVESEDTFTVPQPIEVEAPIILPTSDPTTIKILPTIEYQRFQTV